MEEQLHYRSVRNTAMERSVDKRSRLIEGWIQARSVHHGGKIALEHPNQPRALVCAPGCPDVISWPARGSGGEVCANVGDVSAMRALRGRRR